jgi:hypothetical protein
MFGAIASLFSEKTWEQKVSDCGTDGASLLKLCQSMPAEELAKGVAPLALSKCPADHNIIEFLLNHDLGELALVSLATIPDGQLGNNTFTLILSKDPSQEILQRCLEKTRPGDLANRLERIPSAQISPKMAQIAADKIKQLSANPRERDRIDLDVRKVLIAGKSYSALAAMILGREDDLRKYLKLIPDEDRALISDLLIEIIDTIGKPELSPKFVSQFQAYINDLREQMKIQKTADKELTELLAGFTEAIPKLLLKAIAKCPADKLYLLFTGSKDVLKSSENIFGHYLAKVYAYVYINIDRGISVTDKLEAYPKELRDIIAKPTTAVYLELIENCPDTKLYGLFTTLKPVLDNLSLRTRYLGKLLRHLTANRELRSFVDELQTYDKELKEMILGVLKGSPGLYNSIEEEFKTRSNSKELSK